MVVANCTVDVDEELRGKDILESGIHGRGGNTRCSSLPLSFESSFLPIKRKLLCRWPILASDTRKVSQSELRHAPALDKIIPGTLMVGTWNARSGTLIVSCLPQVD